MVCLSLVFLSNLNYMQAFFANKEEIVQKGIALVKKPANTFAGWTEEVILFPGWSFNFFLSNVSLFRLALLHARQLKLKCSCKIVPRQ